MDTRAQLESLLERMEAATPPRLVHVHNDDIEAVRAAIETQRGDETRVIWNYSTVGPG